MQVRKRVQLLESEARRVLDEAGITEADPWAAVSAVPNDDRYLFSAAYIILQAQCVRDELDKVRQSINLPTRMREEGKEERHINLVENALVGHAEKACSHVSEMEQAWSDLKLLGEGPYGRSLAVWRGGRLYHVDEIVKHDMTIGAKRSEQVLDFSNRSNGPRKEQAETRRQEWRDEDEKLRQQKPHLKSKTERATAIQRRLGETVSVNTISRTLPHR